MAQTTANNLRYPQNTDAVNVAVDIQNLAIDVQANFLPLAPLTTAGSTLTKDYPAITLTSPNNNGGLRLISSSNVLDEKIFGIYVSTGAGGNLMFRSYNDAYALSSDYVSISRAGTVTATGVPTATNHLVPKSYVDDSKHPSERYSFQARYTTTWSCPYSTTTYTTVPFNSKGFDVGGIWSTTNNEATLPVNGVYYFEYAINFAAGPSTEGQFVRFQHDTGGGYVDHRTFVQEGSAGALAGNYHSGAIVYRGAAGTKIRLGARTTATSGWTTSSATQADQNYIQGYMISAY